MLELRPLGPEDHFEIRRLMSHAFGRGRVVTPPTEPPSPSKNLTLGLIEDGHLLSAATVCPFEVHWPGSHTGVLKMGGVAGVATYAEARGQGHVDRLLKECLVAMRDAGQVISSLYPFAWSFYRKYGWDWVGQKHKLTLPLRELPGGPRVARRRTDDEAREAIPALYDAGTRRYRGAFTAATRDFGGPLEHSDDRLTYCYTVEDGYLLWRYPGYTGNGIGDIREYIAATPAAERALLALLRDMGMQTEKAELRVPADHTLWLQCMHWDIRCEAQPVFSARVVDLPQALAALNPESAGQVVLAVTDRHAPWNEGTWEVQWETGTVRCERTTATVELELDIAPLSQAFWGTPSLTDIRRAGLVTVHSEAAFAQLHALLPAAPVMCWNDF